MNARRFLGLAALTLGAGACAIEPLHDGSLTLPAKVSWIQYDSVRVVYSPRGGGGLIPSSCAGAYETSKGLLPFMVSGDTAKSWCDARHAGDDVNIDVVGRYEMQKGGRDSVFFPLRVVGEVPSLIDDIMKRKP